MTRMYVVLFILFAFVLGAGSLLGQQRKNRPVDDMDSLMQKRLQLREEMHRRMMDKLLHGVGPDQDMFSDMDKLMDDLMTDSFSGLALSGARNLNFSMEWLETTSGRTLQITPTDPSQNLDISISNGMITIKGKSQQKTSQGVSVSNFSNMFNVPADCDETKVRMDHKNGKILVQFPFRTSPASKDLPRKQDNRRPVNPSEEDVHI